MVRLITAILIVISPLTCIGVGFLFGKTLDFGVEYFEIGCYASCILMIILCIIVAYLTRGNNG